MGWRNCSPAGTGPTWPSTSLILGPKRVWIGGRPMVGMDGTVAAEKVPGFTFKPSGFGSDFTTTAGLASPIFLAVKPVILEVCVKGWI